MLLYGGVPVPWTVSWSAEETLFLAHCRYAGGLALCQPELPGEGKPRFGKPHSVRQRKAIYDGRCDLCGKHLAARTKVSLSHARPRANAVRIRDILHVQPLLHKECAARCLEHCPSLKRDVLYGTLQIRQVTRYAVQMAIMSEEYCRTIAGEGRKAIGHAKVQLLSWTDRDASWLKAA